MLVEKEKMCNERYVRLVVPPPPAAAREWAGPGWYGPVKATAELALALVLLVLTAPLMLVAVLLVKATSRGPALYSQTRVGHNGRLYKVHKIRTMVHNCERLTGARWSTPGDPRITPVGRFLRKTHLDELPQLWNVLRGEMSLVGPRPERPEFVAQLEQLIPRYRERLAVRPGVTGLAQVQLPADTDLESVRHKTAYDLYYLRQFGPWLDVQVLGATALKVLGVSFATSRVLLGLPTRTVIEEAYQDTIPVTAPAPRLQSA